MDPLSRWLRALADPIRLRLLWLLIDGREHCVCALVEALALPQPTISRHLRTLREAGLIRGRRQGTWTHYSLLPQPPDLAPVLRALRPALERAAAADALSVAPPSPGANRCAS
jgi:ArsR family transcriptional regulator